MKCLQEFKPSAEQASLKHSFCKQVPQKYQLCTCAVALELGH